MKYIAWVLLCIIFYMTYFIGLSWYYRSISSLTFGKNWSHEKLLSEIFWPLRQPFGNLIKVSKEFWAEHGTVNSPCQKLPLPRVVSKSSFISFAISELFFCTSNTVLTYFVRIFVSFNGIEYMIQLSSDSAESPKVTFETMPLKSRGWGPYPIRPSESQGGHSVAFFTWTLLVFCWSWNDF